MARRTRVHGTASRMGMTRAHVRKAFAYAVRLSARGPELLVFHSLEESAGFEVPKGALEPGESFVDAARRELFEESGLEVSGGTELGTTWYADEEQRFFLFAARDDVPDRFQHRVTGGGGDAGATYDFEFRPLDDALAGQLVQGSGAFVAPLRRRLGV